MKIILATHNQDKVKEIVPMMQSLGVELSTLDEFPQISEIVENGSTLRENALIKARTINLVTGIPSLADDTGLEVDALNGAPGIYAARFAGENCTYADNVKKLLLDMKNVIDEKRTAYFRTVVAFVDSGTELIAKGSVEGAITRSSKGVDGFGYDRVFYIPESGKTFAEMTKKEKNKVSHRGIAFQNMKNILREYISEPTHLEETA